MLTDSQIFTLMIIATSVLTITLNLILFYKKSKSRLSWYSKENLVEYEGKVREFLMQKQFSNELSVLEMVEKIGYSVKREKLPFFTDAEKLGCSIVLSDRLNTQESKFCVAHELAHLVFKDPEDVKLTREAHSFKLRSPEEQIRDYVAAALLLPADILDKEMEHADFKNLNSQGKERFINMVSKKYVVNEQLVLRRIQEVKLLAS